MSYEKDKLDSYVTSASLATALAPYVTSNSVSAAIAGLDLTPYVTSNSISAAVTTDALTVRGKAAVSATLSAGAVTIAGRRAGVVVLAYSAINNVSQIGFSGSWSDISFFELRANYLMSGTATASIQIFTDGGTSSILALNIPSNVIGGLGPYAEVTASVLGVDGGPRKALTVTGRNGTIQAQSDYSVITNSGFINCIRLVQSRSMSSGVAMLIGYRNT